MIPLLSRPGYLSFKNRILCASDPSREIVRHLFILSVGILIAVTTFSGTTTTLQSLQELQHRFYIPPQHLLEVSLFFLFMILALTSGISFFSVFLLSNDLELLRASPITPLRFITGKFYELATLSGWILGFFGIPVLLGFGVFFGHPTLFYPSALLLVPLFLILATGCGALGVLIVALLVPTYKAREFILLLALLSIAGSYVWFRSDVTRYEETQMVSDLVRLSMLTSDAPTGWLPSSWFAILFTGYLTGIGPAPTPYILLVLGATGAVMSLLYLGIRTQYESLYTKTYFPHARSQHSSLLLSPLTFLGSKLLSSRFRAFFVKELKLFLRDLTQSIQLVLLLTLCLIYLYNFRRFEVLHNLPIASQYLWVCILSLSNILVSTVVVIAISARFAFPSVSLEGKSWWILQASPLTTEKILTQKTRFWFIVFLLPSVTIFGSGALALQLPIELIALQLLIGVSLCHLYIGLGVAAGAQNANFNWDHPAELTSSFRNLTFMASCTGVCLYTIAPISVITVLFTMSDADLLGQRFLFEGATALMTFLFASWNFQKVSRSLKRAAISLDRDNQQR